MLYDLTLTILASDFKRLDKLSMSRGLCVPIVRKALQRQFPDQEITAPSNDLNVGRIWTIGSDQYVVLDNGREVNRCRLELYGGAPSASLYVFRKN